MPDATIAAQLTMPASRFHPRTASRRIALTAFSAMLFLVCAVHPAIWLLATDNPEINVALIINLMLSAMVTILGTNAYAVALWRASGVAHQVRWRLYMLSAALGIASPMTCFALAWCARHLPVAHLSDTNTVGFLLGCSLIIPCLLGTAFLRLALRRDWLYPSNIPGLCRHCRYNLTGNTSGICPECGTPILASPSSHSAVTTWPPRPRTSQR